MLGLNKDIVDVEMADPDPTEISVIINITFFFLNFYIFFIVFIINFE